MVAGTTLGRLTGVGATDGRSDSGSIVWTWRCECGNTVRKPVSSVTSGNTRSCGCLSRELSAERLRKGRISNARLTHGHSRRVSGPASPEYYSWVSMWTRCTNPKSNRYELYGKLGVIVCDHWKNFENFLADMGPRLKGTSLDRYPNNSGNYEPGNCRWATAKEQANNRR